MKITIFGAGGAIGRLVVRTACERGWEVTAFARHTGNIPSEPRLSFVQAELTDGDAIERALSGAQAVITAFGPPFGRSKTGQTPLTDGISLIVKKMRKYGPRRLIVLATPSVPSDEDTPSWKIRLVVRLVRLLIPEAYREMTGMGRVTMQSGLDWTIVRQILPNNKPPTGLVVHGGVSRKTRLAVSRSDVARFLVDEVEDTAFIRRLPVIYSRRRPE